MFSDRRMILGSLVVLIGLLVFALAGPLSNAGHLHEDHETYVVEEHERHEAREQNVQKRYTAQHGDYDYTEVIERSFSARDGQDLYLDTDFGKVTIRGEGSNEITVVVIKGVNDVSESKAEELFADFDIDFDENDGLVIEGDYEGDRNWGRGKRLQVSYEITVPHEFDVQVKTAGGSIKAEHLRGDAELRTAGGSVTTVDIDGPLVVKTAGGSIKAEAIGGDADLHTSGGSISVEGAQGDVKAHTSGGSIKLYEIHGTADAHTSGGSITADLVEAPDGPVSLKTSGGSVTLHLTADTSIDLDAKASGGRVHTDLDVRTQGKLSKTRLEGTINGGGPLVTLRTSGGSVKILKR